MTFVEREVFACPTCGAIVATEHEGKHRQWHIRLDANFAKKMDWNVSAIGRGQ